MLGFGNGEDKEEIDDLIGTGIVETNRVFEVSNYQLISLINHQRRVKQAVFSVYLGFHLSAFRGWHSKSFLPF